MIALELQEVKPFMNKLLTSEMFHHFLVSEITIINGPTYHIDGHISQSEDTSLKDEFPYLLTTFEKIQSSIFEMIKGSLTPTYMKYVFCLSPDNVVNTITRIQSSLDPSNISGMYINLLYQQNRLICTTGVSYNIFVKDHSLEQEWDRLVKLFFTKHNIIFQELS